MKNNSSKISVIITTHNYASYIGKCIDSLCLQTMAPSEIIVVDDASEDDTKLIIQKKIREFADINIKYFEVDFENAQKSRIFGLGRTSVEYILFFDADNYADQMLIEKMYSNMVNCDADLVYCDQEIIDGNNVKITSWKAGKYSYSRLQRLNYIDMCSMCKRSMLKKDFFDQRVNRFQDWDVWLSYLNEQSKVRYISEDLLKKRVHKKSISNNQEKYLEKLKVMHKHRIIDLCEIDDTTKNNIFFACLCNKCTDHSIDDFFSRLRNDLFTLRRNEFFIFAFSDHYDDLSEIKDKKSKNEEILNCRSWSDLGFLILSQENILIFLNATISFSTVFRKILKK